MRVSIIVAALLLPSAVLAGCVGSGGDEKVDPNNIKVDPGNLGGVLHLLAPLSSKVTLEGNPQWIVPGTLVNFSVATPPAAKGTLTYAWGYGPVSGTTLVKSLNLSTGYIDPGAQASLVFTKPGIYAMHCHPHPYMRQNVTVLDGWDGPSVVHVQIVDGPSADGNPTGGYKFSPEYVVVKPGTTVVYHNNGTQVHTSMELQQDAPLKPLSTSAASGSYAVDGTGWMRFVALMTDSEGRSGLAQAAVYVSPFFPNYNQTFTYSFKTASPANPAQDLAEQDIKSFKAEHNGTVFINYTAKDATSVQNEQAPNLAQVEVHLKEQGATQDTASGDPAASGHLVARVREGTVYTLQVIARQGAQDTVTAPVIIIYDATPPAATAYVDPESIPHKH